MHSDQVFELIVSELFRSAADIKKTVGAKGALIDLPGLILPLARSLATGTYRPRRYTVFVVTDPKPREIFAPALPDRICQNWIVRQLEPWWDKRFIDDNYANRPSRGALAASRKLQALLRKPDHVWYCQIDIHAFFPSIDKAVLQAILERNLKRCPLPEQRRAVLWAAIKAILAHNPTNPPPRKSGDRQLLRLIPPHKSLFGTARGCGLPIGCHTSQFFANIYLNELDQYVKHELRLSGYVRYMDDIVFLADSTDALMAHKMRIETFLSDRLHLRLNPAKTRLQRHDQGIRFVGSILYPHYSHKSSRTLKALRRRLRYFNYLLQAGASGSRISHLDDRWRLWFANNPAFDPRGRPTRALLERMLATLNSYYGLLRHTNSFRIRKSMYCAEFGLLKRYFRPKNGQYTSMRISPKRYGMGPPKP
jgi:hypothetical protein